MLNRLIEIRKSTRAFSNKPVEQEKITLLFEAARWAASSMNEQPWRFIYRTKDDMESYTAVFNTLMDGNKTWAGDAPLLIAVLAKTHFDYKDRQNRHYMYDTGQAVATMLIQLTDLGLVAHQMGGFHMDQAKTVLSVDDRYEIAAIVAVGYPGDVSQLADDLKERELAPRNRKEINEIAFQNQME